MPDVNGTVASHKDPIIIEKIITLIGVIGSIINAMAAIVLPKYIIDNKYFFEKFLPKAPAPIDPIILNRPITAIANAPSVAVELHTTLIKLSCEIGLLASAINAGK